MVEGTINAAFVRRRTVLSVLVMIIVAGFYAYKIIPKESSPDIDIPLIYISMSIEGISPDDGERLLLRPMEQEMTDIEGVKEITSSAYQGGGYVLLEFQAGFDKDKAIEDVQRSVDQARPKLPDSMETEPKVTEVNFSLFPVVAVMLYGDIPQRTLVEVGRRLQDEIEGIPSVLEVNIAGDREDLVEIILEPEKIESYGLKGNELLSFFSASNRLVAAGALQNETGKFAVEVPGLFETVDDILAMPVLSVDDSTIKLSDIATIKKTYKDAESYARINGKPAVGLNVVKRTGENVIDTIDAVKQVVSQEAQNWPDGLEYSFILDNSDTIKSRLVDLQNNLISAILLVMVVLVAFLGWRAALLVGIAVPGAFLSGVLFLYVTGLTVNVVVLFALIMSIGLLVDGAVVVVEYADRKMIEGKTRIEAYSEASRRMAWPIISSTFTTLAAFSPLLFWPDTVGEFMKFMPLTLIAVLASSLFMALIFVPVCGSLLGRPNADKESPQYKALVASETGNLDELDGFTGGYVAFLKFCLNRAGLIVAGTIGLLIAVFVLYAFKGNGVEFFPDIEPEVASVLVHARGNLSIDEKSKIISEIEERILDESGVEVFYSSIGKVGNNNQDIAEDVIGQIQMEFKEWDERDKASVILERVREKTKDIPGVKIETREDEAGPASGKAVEIEVSSYTPDAIPPVIEALRGGLDEIGGFVDVEDSRPLPGITWKLDVDRAQAAKFGLNLSLVGQYVRLVTNGLEVSEYRPDGSDDEIDIVLRYPQDERTLDNLDALRIETNQGPVPIGNFVSRRAEQSVGTINRSKQRRVLTIKADVEEGANAAAQITKVKEWLAQNQSVIPDNVRIEFRGEDEDQREAQAFLTKAFIIALFLMAIILVTQFNSFYHAFLILFAVIMSTIGVMLGLILLGQPFGIIMSGVGVIALAGIVVNNNIVLIDTYQILEKEASSRYEAVLRTGAQRLRPVLLTTATTILGLIPMVLQLNIDFIAREISVGAPSTQWWVQLSTAIVFGLSFATLLTLIVTPCALLLPQTIRNRFSKTNEDTHEKEAF